MNGHRPAIELDASEWVGTPTSLASLRGKVVLIEAFQMLCPGCVRDGVPQAQRVHRALPEVVALGLHCASSTTRRKGLDPYRRP